jgi:outer membrane protein TolC
VQLAATQSRRAVATRAQALAAREMAAAARQRPDPVLRAGIVNLPIDGADRFSLTRDFMTMRNLGVAREFTREDKRRARAAGFEAEATVALAQRDERRATLRHAAALAWLERHDLERLHELLAHQHQQNRLALDAAEAAYRGTRGTLADVLAARAELAAHGDRMDGVRSRIVQSQAMLERYVGADAAQWALGERPDVTSLAHTGVSIDATPMLATLARDIARAEAEVAAARTEHRGDWSAELMFSQRGSQYSNMVSVTLSVPLPTARADRQDREVAARSAALERARAEQEDARREQSARRAALKAEWRSALERGARHERELLPLAEERTRQALATYRAGSGTLAAVFEARRAELGARIERLQLDTDAARAWAQLNTLFAGVSP